MLKQSLIISLSLLLASGIFTSCKKDKESFVGNWIKKYPIDGQGRMDAVTFNIDGSVYITTGYNSKNDELLKDLIMLNSDGSWEQKSNFKGEPRRDAVAFASSTDGYVGTGINNKNKRLVDFYKYNKNTNVWTEISGLPVINKNDNSLEPTASDTADVAVSGAVAFYVNNRGYIGTGQREKYSTSTFYSYNPDEDKWEKSVTINYKDNVYNAQCFVINEVPYVFGGSLANGNSNEMFKFDVATNKWIELNKLTDVITTESFDNDYTIALSSGATFVINGKGYVTTGRTNEGKYNMETWEYNPENDRWTRKTDFEGLRRIGAVGFSVDNRGFVACGIGSESFKDVWEFKPADDYDKNE